MGNAPWSPSDEDLRRIESYARHTTASAVQIAGALKAPVAKVAQIVNEMRAVSNG